MKVLFVSFFYPPFNSITGLRVSKVTHHLLRRGWDLRVLSAARDDLIPDLALEIPAELVTRVPFLDVNALPKLLIGRGRVSRRGFEFGPQRPAIRAFGEIYRTVVNFPDGQIGWFRPALAAGHDLLRLWRPDVIVSVASPWTSHLVGHALARRHRLPWVAEYHDPWTDSRSRRRAWPLSLLERRLEDGVVGAATSIVAVSDAWADQCRERFRRAEVFVIPYGYDSRDYEKEIAPSRWPLTLLYTGRLYHRQHPHTLLQAIRALADAGEIRPGDLHLTFVGRYLAGAEAAIRETAIDPSFVTVSEPRPHADVVSAQQRAHVLVLFLGDDDDVGWRPAKLYEYLGARRPILVVGGSPRHEARRIATESGAGLDARSSDEVADRLREWLMELRSTGTVRYRGDLAAVADLEWGRLAARMDDALRRTVALGSLVVR